MVGERGDQGCRLATLTLFEEVCQKYIDFAIWPFIGLFFECRRNVLENFEQN